MGQMDGGSQGMEIVVLGKDVRLEEKVRVSVDVN